MVLKLPYRDAEEPLGDMITYIGLLNDELITLTDEIENK